MAEFLSTTGEYLFLAAGAIIFLAVGARIYYYIKKSDDFLD